MGRYRAVQPPRRSRKLVTSFVISHADNPELTSEHPLTVFAEQTEQDAAARFIERHKLDAGYINSLTSYLQQAIVARRERRERLHRRLHQQTKVVLGASYSLRAEDEIERS